MYIYTYTYMYIYIYIYIEFVFDVFTTIGFLFYSSSLDTSMDLFHGSHLEIKWILVSLIQRQI